VYNLHQEIMKENIQKTSIGDSTFMHELLYSHSKKIVKGNQ